MIELCHISVGYPSGAMALEDVSLSIAPNEFVFLVGHTGAGKSTLLKLLYAAQRPTSGQVRVAGLEVSTMRERDIPWLRRRLGVVVQDFGLLPDKTVYENVAFALRVTGAGWREVRKRVPQVLEMVGVMHRPDAFPHQLSGGEQQRVAIARALVHEPAVLLADEPTGNLDPATSSGIMQLLEYINNRNTTVVVATHDAAIVDMMQRRVVALAAGRIVRDEATGSYHEDAPDVGETALCG